MIKQLNVLRALAALSIVMIHVTSGQMLTNDTAYTVNQLSRFASPLFIIMAGMVLVYVETSRPSPSVAYFYKKRFSKVLVPYVLWTVAYVLYNQRHLVVQLQWQELGAYFAAHLPGHLLRGSAFSHLYFILIMVQLYALFPLLHRWLKAHAASMLSVSFTLTALFNGLIYAHRLGWITLPALPVPYVVLFVNWLFYFCLGMAVMRHEARWRRVVLSKPVLWLIPWIVGAAVLLYDGRATGTFDISVKPASIVYGVFSFVLLYAIVYKLRLPDTPLVSRLGAGAEWIARNSFLVYLLHPLCLNALVRASVKLERGSIFYKEQGLALLYVCTIACTLIGILVINRLPFSGWLGGARRRSRSSKAVILPAGQNKSAQ